MRVRISVWLMLVIGLLSFAAVPHAAAMRYSVRTPQAAAALDYSQVAQGRTQDGGFILGDPDAFVTIIIFQDYLCPHCQAYQPTLLQFIEEQVLKGRARLEYRFMPVIDATYSVLMSDLTECADMLRPGAFWPARDVMFTLTTAAGANYGPDIAADFADEMAFDYDDLMDCTEDADQVTVDQLYGAYLGVMATPTVFVQYGDRAPIMQQPLPTYDDLAGLIELQ